MIPARSPAPTALWWRQSMAIPRRNYIAGGPDAITSNLSTLDPFGLPYQSGSQQIPNSTTTIPKAIFRTTRSNCCWPAPAPPKPKASASMSRKTAPAPRPSTNSRSMTAAPGSTDRSPSIQPTAVETGLIGSDLKYLRLRQRDRWLSNGATARYHLRRPGASYGLAWGQYDSATAPTRSTSQIFSPNGNDDASSAEQADSPVGQCHKPGGLPAWVLPQCRRQQQRQRRL